MHGTFLTNTSLARTAELVRELLPVLQAAVPKPGIAESLFLAMRREIESAQLDFLITGGVCKA